MKEKIWLKKLSNFQHLYSIDCNSSKRSLIYYIDNERLVNPSAITNFFQTTEFKNLVG